MILSLAENNHHLLSHTVAENKKHKSAWLDVSSSRLDWGSSHGLSEFGRLFIWWLAHAVSLTLQLLKGAVAILPPSKSFIVLRVIQHHFFYFLEVTDSNPDAL